MHRGHSSDFHGAIRVDKERDMTGQKDSSIRRNLNRIDDTAIAALWEAKSFLLEAQTMQAATVQSLGDPKRSKGHPRRRSQIGLFGTYRLVRNVGYTTDKIE